MDLEILSFRNVLGITVSVLRMEASHVTWTSYFALISALLVRYSCAIHAISALLVLN